MEPYHAVAILDSRGFEVFVSVRGAGPQKAIVFHRGRRVIEM